MRLIDLSKTVFVSLMLFSAASSASMLATRDSRESLLNAKLLSLPLSQSTRDLLQRKLFTRSSWSLKTVTVGDLATQYPFKFGDEFLKWPRAESELLNFLKKNGLRQGMTPAELILYVEDGKIPEISRISSVSAVGLPTRAVKALIRKGIFTVGEINESVLKTLSEKYLVGEITIHNMRIALADAGFPTRRKTIQRQFYVRKKQPAAAIILSTTNVRQIGLSRRSVNILLRANIETVGDAKKTSLRTLSDMIGVGEFCISEISTVFRNAHFPFIDDADFICESTLANPIETLEDELAEP